MKRLSVRPMCREEKICFRFSAPHMSTETLDLVATSISKETDRAYYVLDRWGRECPEALKELDKRGAVCFRSRLFLQAIAEDALLNSDIAKICLARGLSEPEIFSALKFETNLAAYWEFIPDWDEDEDEIE